MEGPATWMQLTWLTGVVLSVAGAVGWMVWFYARQQSRAVDERARERHDMRSGIDQKFVIMTEKFEALDKRIDGLEMFNEALKIILKEMDSFKGELNRRFDKLETQRREDMQGLHTRLDVLLHQEISRVNRVARDAGS